MLGSLTGLLTSSGSSVLLHSLSLLDEGILGGGETALRGRAGVGSAELAREALSRADGLALRKHFGLYRLTSMSSSDWLL